MESIGELHEIDLYENLLSQARAEKSQAEAKEFVDEVDQLVQSDMITKQQRSYIFNNLTLPST